MNSPKDRQGRKFQTFGESGNFLSSIADLLLKGECDAADHIVGGRDHSTLANDAFPAREFDFMIEHAGDPEYSMVTRSSDDQMLYLTNVHLKMKHANALSSRIAGRHLANGCFDGEIHDGQA